MSRAPADSVNGRVVYFDGHATTPLAPEAAAAMAPLWAEEVGNAHSQHGRGQAAAARVEMARGQVARLIGAEPSELIFTCGATEANNLALFGVAEAALRQGLSRRKIVASAVEHKSVLAVLDELAADGFEVALAPVTRDGLADLAALAALVDDETLLVSVMGANNEVGVLQPLAAVAAIARARGALVHSDLAQLAGKVRVDVAALDLDYASLSAHKMYGPPGVGALYVSGLAQVRPRPRMFGGGQEGGLRAGTLPGPLIAGFGVAAELARVNLVGDGDRQDRLADRLLEGLAARQVRYIQNAAAAPRLPGSLSLQFPGADADDLVGRLSSVVAVSTGSACSSGQITSSYVLRAMKLSEDEANSTVRIYVNRYLSEPDIDFGVEQISAALR